jgi:hypothetical protein
MRMTNPNAAGIKIWILGSLKAILFALPVAAIVVMVESPDGVPPAKHELTTRFVSMDLQELVDSPQPRTTTFTEADINAFLGSGKVKSTSVIPGVEYRRAFASLTPGACRISIERAVFGYPLYFGTLYRAEAASGVLSATNIGGNIGRMAIHPLLMHYLDLVLFSELQTSLKPEYDRLKKLDALHIDKGRVTITGRGAKK